MARAEVLQICTRCGAKATKSSLSKLFYMSYSPYHEKHGRVHICKDCIGDFSVNGTEFIEEKFIKVLKQLDKPFYRRLLEASMKETKKILLRDEELKEEKLTETYLLFNHGRDIIGTYMKNIGMRQYKGDVFADGEMGTEVEQNNKGSEEIKNIVELKEKYGYGYTNEEYLNFERKYKKMSVGYQEKTAIHTERFIDYIIKKVKQEMALAEGDVQAADKYESMAKNAAVTAKLNVNQLSKNDVTGGIDLVPQLVTAVEDAASLIPIMPKLKEVPYDDADVIIWAINNKVREIDNLPHVEYSEIYKFYDDFIHSFYEEKGLSKEEIQEEIRKRKTVFRDLGEIYYEPTYEKEEE